MPKPTKNLILCMHAHQPIGNFDSVFERAYELSYKPFFDVLEKHPKISMSCHFSGCLIDWLEIHKPEFIIKLRAMADRGQVEFVGGGYYEPIYGVIPKKDLSGQIRMMMDKIRKLFGQTPDGVWLTERVWDPDLTEILAKNSVRYTILDDFHFEKSGKTLPILGYYKTTHKKSSVDLFASMKELRYLMPFHKAEETIEYIRSTAADASEAFVFADDIEKFGMWPGTYHWVYEEGWLEQLFTLLEKDDTISVTTFREFRTRFKPKGSVRIPHASYSEMMEWSNNRFYNFFDKYSESRYMRDRMLGVSRALQTSTSKNGKKAEAVRALYRAQCNCSYWHGVFGGLYLHHLRSAVFENLIVAESLLRESGTKTKKSTTSVEKVVLGSEKFWYVRQKDIASFFNPEYGACLEELDSLRRSVNLMCNLQRRREPYHDAVFKKAAEPSGGIDKILSIHEMLGSKEKDLEKRLHYDHYKKLSFMDHIFVSEISPEDFEKATYHESGDFISGSYKIQAKKDKKSNGIDFYRKGFVEIDGDRCPLSIRKAVYPIGDSTIRVQYLYKNESKKSVRFVWGAEFNFSIGDNDALKGVDRKNITEWIFNDSWRNLRIKLVASSEVRLIAVPIETISGSESGLERTYQELGVLLQREIYLEPGEAREYALELQVDVR